MIIQSVYIRNYRSVLDETLSCDALTVLVGANGVGKSCFLRALELFYSNSPQIDIDDFYNRNTSQEISICITFNQLSNEAKKLFQNYLSGESLSVERVFNMSDGRITSKYHGSSPRYPGFKDVRDAMEVKDRGKTAKAKYEAIKNESCQGLPEWSNAAAAEVALKEWESANPILCVRQRDDGQFFGFKQVGQGYLGRFTRFLYVPAVREAASDASEGRGSVLTELMDLVVRSVLAGKEEIRKLREETKREYQELIKRDELDSLAKQMTTTLNTYVPDARIELDWRAIDDINIPVPQANVRLVEDGYSAPVARTGHGLQRAFILTMLQRLALAQVPATSTDTPPNADGKPIAPIAQLPNLVLAIEEPELFQHPSRQRHLARIMLKLATGTTPGVAEHTQVVYSTHSPLFVGMDRIQQLRLLKKESRGESKPKVTKIVKIDLNRIAETLWKADGQPSERYTAETVLQRMQAIMTPVVNEGFFADAAILVEGEDDRAVILGMARCMGHELESRGIAVIPCTGKRNLDRPAAIFQQLGIKTYVIWDGDAGTPGASAPCPKCGKTDGKPNPKDNHCLLTLLGRPAEDWPEHIDDSSACFKHELETTLRNEIGEKVFDQCLAACQIQFGIKRKHALKNPNVIAKVIEDAKSMGCSSPTLCKIIERIVALKGAPPPPN